MGEKTFGERLRELRKAAGMTQEGLARAADLTTATVYKLEANPDQDPAWSTVGKLAKALGVSVAAFVSDGATAPVAAPVEAEAKPSRRRKKGGEA